MPTSQAKIDPAVKQKQAAKLIVQYLGKREIELNLPYLSEQGLVFTPGSTNEVSKSDAAKLIRENPRMFKVVMQDYEEEVVQEKKDTGFRDTVLEDIRALLESMPSKKAIVDYCNTEYGVTLDGSLKKEMLLDEAIREIQDTANIGG